MVGRDTHFSQEGISWRCSAFGGSRLLDQLPAESAREKERRGSSGKLVGGSRIPAAAGGYFQRWGDSGGEEQHARSGVLSGALYSFPTTWGILAAEPCVLAGSAKAGRFPAKWLALSGPTWFRFIENPLFAFRRFCFPSQSASQNELFSGQPG